MKMHENWSYAPYKPLFWESGDIYINRIAPEKTSITFDWSDTGEKDYDIFCRIRNEGEFSLVGKTKENSFTIENLTENKEYEFYVAAGEKKSRIRLAECAKAFGTVVNYLHPEDDIYSFSGRYLCSPSIVRHPDGYLLASMDVFAGEYPQNLTLIYRSDDDGKSWRYVSELFPCFWCKLFIYDGDLYALGCSTEYGDLLIGKSTDGGYHFSPPTVLFRGSNGKHGECGIHKNPQLVVEYAGRIWNTLEWGSWDKFYHAVMVMSAPLGSDLLEAKNWSFSEPVKYNPEWEGVAKGESAGNIEGCLLAKDGVFYNIMRYHMIGMEPNYGLIMAYKVDTENPENPLEFDHVIPFPCNHSKFEIKYDEKTKKYYSIGSRILNSENAYSRNLLSLMVSDDAENWSVLHDIIDKTDCDPRKVGFQYVDFLIEGDKILYLCRTAMNGAANFHDTNYSIFDTINYVDLLNNKQ